jgi:hypothetical protein
MIALVQDLRYAARVFRRAPGFLRLAVLTIAIAIADVVHLALGERAERRTHVDDDGPSHSADGDEGNAAKVPVLESKQPDLGGLGFEADDGVEMSGIGELGHIARRRLGRRKRVRVIEADDFEPAFPRGSPRREMVLRVDHEPPRRILGNIPRWQGRDDVVATAEQQAAALMRRRRPGMFDERGGHFVLHPSYFEL